MSTTTTSRTSSGPRCRAPTQAGRQDKPTSDTRAHRDRGANAIEFAITAVAVMAIIFAAIQAATYFWARSIALAAAERRSPHSAPTTPRPVPDTLAPPRSSAPPATV